MFFDKLRRFIGLKKKGETKEILVSCEPLETRVALLEGGILEEFAVERGGAKEIAGNIYKGRVHNVEPGLKALFVDIGVEKNAFLHYWDAVPAALDAGVEAVERKGRKRKTRSISADDIPQLYPPGSEVVVQVSKGPIGNKGARVTTNITLAGRYLVLLPYSEQFGISRKIEDPKERMRLRKILQELDVPEGMGLIIRTVGEGKKARYFVRDLAMLLEQWRAIEERIRTEKAPALLYAEPDLIERTVRDFLTEDVDQIVVDDEQAYGRIRELVGKISKRSQRKIRLYKESVPIFERFNVEKQIDTAFRRQVWLPSGGYIVIDETEALVAIDVNTGRAKASGREENTILQTNLEAAEEVARQLRLRNIGGLVIIDFIDMRSKRDQNLVVHRLKECLRRDKARTHVLPISPLGLVEMTRQRVQESIWQSQYVQCPYCEGRGVIKSPETMSVEIQRAITTVMRSHPEVRELRIVVNHLVLERLKTEDEDILVDLERKLQGKLLFRADPKVHVEEFHIYNAVTNQELYHRP
ncbi:Rne/Rng family ribonuclease [Candidatus Methylacidithermus pantelleriae]|uniref:Ribonuclease G n=1 Tax=Candidatus Methylacidithermus pantelleriae TaxID=2744239 RepID=A0A8J2FNA0_9BACT|nr:Rne/Rng family ribonuclease [Candidatus Methylacidithermus pantelleriae]CAF0689923.1 Ribonuclease G [Candidatus Methylacidithermus pantelleriae]